MLPETRNNHDSRYVCFHHYIILVVVVSTIGLNINVYKMGVDY